MTITVADLIAKLKDLPQDLPVYTPGFDEGAAAPVSKVEVLTAQDEKWADELEDAREFGGEPLPESVLWINF